MNADARGWPRMVLLQPAQELPPAAVIVRAPGRATEGFVL